MSVIDNHRENASRIFRTRVNKNSDKIKMKQEAQLTVLSDINKLCRTCLSEGDLKPLFECRLFLGMEISLASILVECAYVKVSEGDGFPTQICQFCIEEAYQAYQFKHKCKETELRLQNYALLKSGEGENKTIKTENEDDVDDDICVPSPEIGSNSSTENDVLPQVGQKRTIKRNKYTNRKCVRVKARPLRRTRDIEEKTFCEKCNISFNSNAEYARHSKVKHQRKFKYQCNMCSKCFVTASKLEIHIRSHTREKPFSCDVCELKFTSRGNLQRHLMTHTGERPHRCHICGKGFIQAPTLADHLRVHTGETPFVCSVCGKTFKQQGQLRVHEKKHLPKTKEDVEKEALKTKNIIKPEKTFLCSECGKAFSTKFFLVLHNRIHTGERPYSCNVCNKSFKQKGVLKTHSLIHTDEKRHTCSVCGKTFKRKAGLKIHSVVHTGDKPFSCNSCDKTFSQGGHLKYHMRIHSGEKPYSCDVCGKCFTLKGNLTVHVRTHTGETPYVCWFCGKGFYDSSSMKKHQKGHGNIKQE